MMEKSKCIQRQPLILEAVGYDLRVLGSFECDYYWRMLTVLAALETKKLLCWGKFVIWEVLATPEFDFDGLQHQ